MTPSASPATSRTPLTHLLVALPAVALLAVGAVSAASSRAAGANPDSEPRELVSPGGPVVSEPGAGEPLAVILEDDGAVLRAAGAPDAVERIEEVVEADGGTVRRDLSAAGVVAVTGDAGTAAQLEALPGVAAVVPDEPLRPLGGDPAAPATSYSPHAALKATSAAAGWPAAGAGRTVAILDTGVQSAHPSLAGKVVATACFSTNMPASGITPACAGDTPELLGEPCTFSNCNHGTAVAGVAAGHVRTSGTHTGGLAPGADIAAVQVFSKVTGPSGCPGGCPLAYPTDVIAALTWLASVAEDLDLASVNLSLGGQPGASACTNDLGGAAVRALRAKGVAVIAAAGNDGNPNLVSWPACAPDVIAVGASSSATGDTWSTLAVDRYNAGEKVALVAPGYRVPAPVPGATDWWLHNGTSFASPAVAGAAAVWRERNPDDALDGLVPAITSGTVTDTRTNAQYPKLWVAGLFPASLATTTTTAAPPPTSPPTTAPRPKNRPAMVSLERAHVSGRTLQMSGWALDPDGGKPRVRVVINGRAIWSPPVAGRRDDVWNFLSRNVDRNSGWSHTRVMGARTHNVCVDLADAGSNRYHSRTCRQVVVK